MTKSITLKDLSPDLLANMARRASDEGRSVQEMVRRLLSQTYGDNPAIVIGWIKLDRWGEIDEATNPATPAPLAQIAVAILTQQRPMWPC